MPLTSPAPMVVSLSTSLAVMPKPKPAIVRHAKPRLRFKNYEELNALPDSHDPSPLSPSGALVTVETTHRDHKALPRLSRVSR